MLEDSKVGASNNDGDGERGRSIALGTILFPVSVFAGFAVSYFLLLALLQYQQSETGSANAPSSAIFLALLSWLSMHKFIRRKTET